MDVESLYRIFTEHPIVCTDTRKINEGCIFFALKGPKFDANSFAKEAIEKGAAYAVIDNPTYYVDSSTILVEDVLTCLQQLARLHRKKLGIPVIGIVGSNGKTTTKELITAVLQTEKKVWSTPGNFNNHIGLPLTLLMLNDTHEIAVIEMGANHIGENAVLCEIAAPDYGIITNNGKDHLEGFGSIEGVAQSNSELYYYLLKHNGIAFVNAQDEWLMRMASRLPHKITYAGIYNESTADANVIGQSLSLRPKIKFTYLQSIIESHLSGDYNFDNIMAAVAIGSHFGISATQIKQGIESYEPKNNRSQVVHKKENTIYLDAYNANPSSMEASLRNFAAMMLPNSVAILGDMYELGRYSNEEHQKMISFCEAFNHIRFLFVGHLFNQFKTNKHVFLETSEQALDYIKNNPFSGCHIFMKASRGLGLEQLAEVIN